MRIIAGPCQHESLEHSMMIAEHCARACAKYPNIEYYYKASYDNAPSDGPNMLHLQDFEEVIDDIHRYSYTR